jgi:3-oxoacyl-[acyl-carrier-protein] synthase-3
VIGSSITAIEYYLPEAVLTNEQLTAAFPEWSIEQIEEKTGIRERHIAAPQECSSDLAAAAVQKLFSSGACRPQDIDFILLCTQSPDYFLPTTACLLQHRLGMPSSAGALDFNLGCSGYIYGLGLAKGLVETGQARCVLLITAETYSKFIHPQDKSVRTIFGDAASATLVQAGSENGIGPFVFGTDGSGAQNLIVPVGGMRLRQATESTAEDDFGNLRNNYSLFMNGPEIFQFTLRAVPDVAKKLLTRSGLRLEEIDLFVFHQANRYMLSYLQRKLKIPEEKFYVFLQTCGNTVSSTIPIALKHAALDGTLAPGMRVMLVGFGVGYSWGAALVNWNAKRGEGG